MLPRRGLPAPALQPADPRAFYQMLEAYYLNNGLYQAWPPQELFGAPGGPMRSLRNPANRAVEFHVTHTWPGSLQRALPLVGASPQLAKAIGQLWAWSNWEVKKQLAVRWFALFGDWFCKVAARPNAQGRPASVYLQNIKPEMVTDFELDERGNLVSIRLDWLTGEGPNALATTELWSKQQGYALYQGRRPLGDQQNRLGQPLVRRPLADFGIDFVPFVHASFIDIGEKRGMGVFAHALDKIDEVNRMSTRLHQLIFRYNRPTLALLANGTDAAGRPLPPPRLFGEGALAPTDETDADGEMLSLPGNSRIEYLVPPLNYSAHLDAIGAMAAELEEDLPELAYYRQRELGSNLSGKAVRLLLAQAVNRTAEARGNLEAALVRAHKMALTMGAQAGLFAGIGNYAAGNFEHSFAERDVLPLSAEERAATLASEVAAGVPLPLAAQRQGWYPAELGQLNQLLAHQQPTQQGGNECNPTHP